LYTYRLLLGNIFSDVFSFFGRFAKISCNWGNMCTGLMYLIIIISESFSLRSTRTCDLNKLQCYENRFSCVSPSIWLLDVFLLLYVELPNGTVKLISIVYKHWPNCRNVSNSTYPHTARLCNFSKTAATDPVSITINIFDTF